MSSENQTNLNKQDTFDSEEDTEISLPPPAANFETAQAAPAQPVIPISPISGETFGAIPQQPQVVYVAQPTIVEPRRSWGWIPAALALLIVATIAGVFIGAELYKRSIYAESAAPYSNGDVSPYTSSTTNENKSVKSVDENSLADKKEIGSSESFKSESKQINSVSTGFAPIQKTDLRENNSDIDAGVNEDVRGENNQEQAEDFNQEVRKSEDQTEKISRQQDEEDAPPPPVQRKSKEFQPRKVENIKDTENIVPPQRNLPY